MFWKIFSELKLFVIIAFVIHLIFFYPIYISNNTYNSGKDAIRLHYASKIYFYDNVREGKIPLWTDKMFGGYPIFYDLERGYQNLVNDVLIYFFGPYSSFKILVLICYLFGSICFYKLFKQHFNLNLINLVILNTLYFFSYYPLLHLQHQNIFLSVYLLPCFIYLCSKYLKTPNWKLTLLNLFLYYFVVTLGSLQIVLIIACSQLLYFFVFKNNFQDFFKIIIKFLVLPFVFLIPSFYYFFQMYLDSQRIENFSNIQGQLNLNYFATIFFPFILGRVPFYGLHINPEYFQQEFILYFSASISLLSIFLISQKYNSKFKKLFIFGCLIFIIINFINIPPFNFFRYWVRGIFMLNFFSLFLLAEFLCQNLNLRFNKITILAFLTLFILLASNFINPDFRFVFLNSLTDFKLDLFVLSIILILTFWFLFKKKNLIIFLIFLEFIFFWTRNDFHLFIDSSLIDVVNLEKNEYGKTFDDFSLLKDGPTLAGYSQLVPKNYPVNYDEFSKKYNFTNFLKFYLISAFVTLFLYWQLDRNRVKF